MAKWEADAAAVMELVVLEEVAAAVVFLAVLLSRDNAAVQVSRFIGTLRGMLLSRGECDSDGDGAVLATEMVMVEWMLEELDLIGVYLMNDAGWNLGKIKIIGSNTLGYEERKRESRIGTQAKLLLICMLQINSLSKRKMKQMIIIIMLL